MAFAGTDYYRHLAFQRQAERYRRRFVQQMNHEMEVHSKMGDWDYRSGRRVFAAVAPFRYQPPGLMASISHQLPGMISILIWLILIGWAVRRYPVYLNQS
jgi:ABC-2 type transport system permease protein